MDWLHLSPTMVVTSRRTEEDDATGLLYTTARKSVSCVCVLLLSLETMDLALQQKGLPTLEEMEAKVVLTTILRNLDRLSGLPTDEYGNRLLELRPADVIALLSAPKLSDRQIRRFMVRHIYDSITRSTLNEYVILDEWDMAACAADFNDFQRNAELLAEEGYFRIGTFGGDSFDVLPTAKLVREVERYGAAKEDVVSERDYLGGLESYTIIADQLPIVRMEYQRYGHATSPIELSSVFKAIAPVVELVAKNLLRAHGSKKEHPTLGPVIADLQARGIGNQVLWGELSHVLKFGRDIELHGGQMSESMLRIACENAFELLPQLAALFPR
jgi:hypothetical protein